MACIFQFSHNAQTCRYFIKTMLYAEQLPPLYALNVAVPRQRRLFNKKSTILCSYILPNYFYSKNIRHHVNLLQQRVFGAAPAQQPGESAFTAPG
ncbi:hypothetical protein [Desulfovibrio desulfuricans]|uniref:hypothetical protein n=1 Tax=Desulfovibrio desulfuricans TaxID=876 RepID=UPI00131C68EA|nr:hypothetical protein [Desulfovibrio desulfuricans]MDD3683573.1 hypothetical protein [Desulfovibrio desulfuricans]QTO39930.1 hypothetical protein J8J02_12625 [Desulfovibrio desulfuricans]